MNTISASDDTNLTLARDRWQFRRVLIIYLALSISMPMAWISIGKLLLFAVTLTLLVVGLIRQRRDAVLIRLASTRFLLGLMLLFSLSLLWTSADTSTALGSLVKHSKLLTIVLVASLIRSPGDARAGLLAFGLGQLLLLIGSWALVAGLPFRYVPVYFGIGVYFPATLTSRSFLQQVLPCCGICTR